MVAICLLAACGTADGEDARAAAPDSGAAAIPADSPAAATTTAADDTFAFRPHGTRPGVVDSITVTRGGRVVQTLVPSENEVPPETSVERISRPDLDWDGHADLGFVTELTMASSHSQYWRLDPATGRFAPAGVFETLQADSAAREFSTHVRGGYAGRLWTASRWRWMDGALAEVRNEEQDVLPDDAGFVHIVRERRGGALVETSRDTLEGAEVRAAATWAEP
jgi:hypothetical protein